MKYAIFLIALIFITIGLTAFFMVVLDVEDDALLGIVFIPISLTMFFYLWKNNFFQRND